MHPSPPVVAAGRAVRVRRAVDIARTHSRTRSRSLARARSYTHAEACCGTSPRAVLGSSCSVLFRHGTFTAATAEAAVYTADPCADSTEEENLRTHTHMQLFPFITDPTEEENPCTRAPTHTHACPHACSCYSLSQILRRREPTRPHLFGIVSSTAAGTFPLSSALNHRTLASLPRAMGQRTSSHILQNR